MYIIRGRSIIDSGTAKVLRLRIKEMFCMKKNYFKRLRAVLRPWCVSLVYGAKLSEKTVGDDIEDFGRCRKCLFVLLMILTAVVILPAVVLSMAGDKKNKLVQESSGHEE